MYRLVYLSQAKPELDEGEIQSIVDRSVEKNLHRGITGFMCLRDRFFLQYLEGDEAAVAGLYENLCHDNRHEIVRTVILDPHKEKHFHGWSMRWLDKHFLGQLALEDKLAGVMQEFGRGKVDDPRLREMAERLVELIAQKAQ